MKTTISDLIIGRSVPLKTAPIQIPPPMTPNPLAEIQLYILNPKTKTILGN